MILRCTVVGVPEILAEFDQLGHAFDLDKDDLGRLLLEIAAQQILVQMAMELDPDDIPWPQLSPSYADWKYTVAPGAHMGVLYGHMAAYDQIAGQQTITREFASMDYGIDEIARVEAIKFTFGGIVTGTNQPQRPFYGLTRMAEDRATIALAHHFDHAW